MTTHPATPYQTTLAAALDASAVTISTAASTGFAVGKFLAIGNEVLELTAVDTTNHVHSVKRGMKGTQAVAHANAATVSMGAASAFGPNTKDGIEIAGYSGGALGTPKLPIGSKWVDPATGYEYILCDSAAAYILGEWVVITPDGAASQLAATSKGRVGVVVEAVSASDKLFWVLVVGSFASCNLTSDVTTAIQLAAGTGTLDWPTSTATPLVRGVSCTTAPSTATSPGLGGGVGTCYLNNPWVDPAESAPYTS